MLRNHDFVAVEEHVCHAYGLVEQAAAVVAKVNDKAIELGVIELIERGGKVAIRGLVVEGGDTDVPDARLDESEIFNGGVGDLVAHYSDFDGLLPADATERDVNGRSARAFQKGSNRIRGEAVAIFGVNFQDNVSGANAGFECRGAHERRNHDDLICALGDLHAYAVIAALLVFAKFGEGGRIEEIRVRV